MTTTSAETPFGAAPGATIPAVLGAYADLYGEWPYVVDRDRTLTASEFAAVCAQLRAGYVAFGLEAGSPVGVLLPNGWKWIAATLSLASAGLVAVPLNTWYKEAELRSARSKAGLRAIITQDTILGRDARTLLAATGLDTADPADNYFGSITWNGGGLPEGMDPASSAPPADVRAEDAALYVFTSGSSAAPKVVILIHADLMRNGDAIGERLGVVPGDSMWYAQPLFFGLGCANALMVATTRGLTICVEERFDAWQSPRFIEAHRCTVAYVRGLMVQRMIDAGSLEAVDVSSLRRGVVSLSPAEKRLCIETLGMDLACSVYGLTEVYGLATMTEPGDPIDVVASTQGTCLPTHEIRCWNIDTDSRVEEGSPDHLGEIQVLGTCTPGYLDNVEANAAAFTTDGWFRTGDLGWLDDAGRLHFAGRLKEVVKVHGITVSPAEVESYVREHPDVTDAWAFGWRAPGPADDGEEELCCAVRLRSGAELAPWNVTEGLRTWLCQRISSYKVPKRFVALEVDQIPLTDTGKVSKRLIGDQYFSRPA